MSGKGGGGKGVGGMTYTRQMPNFLQKMMQQDTTGIDGAIRRADAQPEKEEREDREDERPVVVDESEARLGKERRGGTLRFKGESSTAAKFKESAYERVLQAERDAAAITESGPSDVGSSSQKIIFSSGAAQKKRKHDSAGKTGRPAAKAVKNTKLLSFEEED